MLIHELSSTDAFIAFDCEDAPAAGVTRLARKVLQDGAELLARSTTYSFASFEVRMCGGSAGINAGEDARDDAVAAFVDETQQLVADGRWVTDPGVGLAEADLSRLRIEDRRPPELWTDGVADALTARGAVAAAGAVRDRALTGARCAIVGKGPVTDAARRELDAVGATVVDGGTDAEADVLFLAGKAGVLDHDAAADVGASVVVPLTPVPVTARAHAILSAADRVHVPDFLSIAAPLLHAHAAHVDDPVDAVRAKVAGFAGEGTGMWMAAVAAAEDYLSTWRDELPFGRPLA